MQQFIILYCVLRYLLFKNKSNLQCKEQSDRMLEQSCLTVENAAKGGGVYPEVLFQVAMCWYDLYVGVRIQVLIFPKNISIA